MTIKSIYSTSWRELNPSSLYFFTYVCVCVCVCVVCFQQNRVSLSILFLTLLSFHLKSYVNTFSHLHSILLSCKVKAQSCLTVISWTVACQAPLSMELSRQEHWSGFAYLLQGIVLTQGSKLYIIMFLIQIYIYISSNINF